jgi:tetratricopeptide (TPR) repeat protein
MGASWSRAWLAAAVCFVVGLGAMAFVFHGRPQPRTTPAAVAPDPAAAQAHVTRARHFIESQESAKAQAELELAQPLAPDDAEIPFLLGDLAYRTLQMELAERYYRRATELDPRSAAAFGNLALVLLELGQAQAAVDATQRALTLSPADPRFEALLGQGVLRLGRPQEAAQLLEGALKKGVRGAQRFAALGRALDLLGRKVEALAALDEAVRQDPGLPQVHYWRAECLRRAGQRAQAERELAAYRECQLRIDRLVRAELKLRQAPDDVTALLEVARLRVERGVPGQALPPLLRAEQLASGDPKVREVGALVRRAKATTRDAEP